MPSLKGARLETTAAFIKEKFIARDDGMLWFRGAWTPPEEVAGWLQARLWQISRAPINRVPFDIQAPELLPVVCSVPNNVFSGVFAAAVRDRPPCPFDKNLEWVLKQLRGLQVTTHNILDYKFPTKRGGGDSATQDEAVRVEFPWSTGSHRPSSTVIPPRAEFRSRPLQKMHSQLERLGRQAVDRLTGTSPPFGLPFSPQGHRRPHGPFLPDNCTWAALVALEHSSGRVAQAQVLVNQDTDKTYHRACLRNHMVRRNLRVVRDSQEYAPVEALALTDEELHAVLDPDRPLREQDEAMRLLLTAQPGAMGALPPTPENRAAMPLPDWVREEPRRLPKAAAATMGQSPLLQMTLAITDSKAEVPSTTPENLLDEGRAHSFVVSAYMSLTVTLVNPESPEVTQSFQENFRRWVPLFNLPAPLGASGSHTRNTVPGIHPLSGLSRIVNGLPPRELDHLYLLRNQTLCSLVWSRVPSLCWRVEENAQGHLGCSLRFSRSRDRFLLGAYTTLPTSTSELERFLRERCDLQDESAKDPKGAKGDGKDALKPSTASTAASTAEESIWDHVGPATRAFSEHLVEVALERGGEDTAHKSERGAVEAALAHLIGERSPDDSRSLIQLVLEDPARFGSTGAMVAEAAQRVTREEAEDEEEEDPAAPASPRNEASKTNAPHAAEWEGNSTDGDEVDRWGDESRGPAVEQMDPTNKHARWLARRLQQEEREAARRLVADAQVVLAPSRTPGRMAHRTAAGRASVLKEAKAKARRAKVDLQGKPTDCYDAFVHLADRSSIGFLRPAASHSENAVHRALPDDEAREGISRQRDLAATTSRGTAVDRFTDSPSLARDHGSVMGLGTRAREQLDHVRLEFLRTGNPTNPGARPAQEVPPSLPPRSKRPASVFDSAGDTYHTLPCLDGLDTTAWESDTQGSDLGVRRTKATARFAQAWTSPDDEAKLRHERRQAASVPLVSGSGAQLSLQLVCRGLDGQGARLPLAVVLVALGVETQEQFLALCSVDDPPEETARYRALLERAWDERVGCDCWEKALLYIGNELFAGATGIATSDADLILRAACHLAAGGLVPGMCRPTDILPSLAWATRAVCRVHSGLAPRKESIDQTRFDAKTESFHLTALMNGVVLPVLERAMSAHLLMHGTKSNQSSNALSGLGLETVLLLIENPGLRFQSVWTPPTGRSGDRRLHADDCHHPVPGAFRPPDKRVERVNSDLRLARQSGARATGSGQSAGFPDLQKIIQDSGAQQNERIVREAIQNSGLSRAITRPQPGAPSRGEDSGACNTTLLRRVTDRDYIARARVERTVTTGRSPFTSIEERRMDGTRVLGQSSIGDISGARIAELRGQLPATAFVTGPLSEELYVRLEGLATLLADPPAHALRPVMGPAPSGPEAKAMSSAVALTRPRAVRSLQTGVVMPQLCEGQLLSNVRCVREHADRRGWISRSIAGSSLNPLQMLVARWMIDVRWGEVGFDLCPVQRDPSSLFWSFAASLRTMDKAVPRSLGLDSAATIVPPTPATVADQHRDERDRFPSGSPATNGLARTAPTASSGSDFMSPPPGGNYPMSYFVEMEQDMVQMYCEREGCVSRQRVAVLRDLPATARAGPVDGNEAGGAVLSGGEELGGDESDCDEGDGEGLSDVSDDGDASDGGDEDDDEEEEEGQGPNGDGPVPSSSSSVGREGLAGTERKNTPDQLLSVSSRPFTAQGPDAIPILHNPASMAVLVLGAEILEPPPVEWGPGQSKAITPQGLNQMQADALRLPSRQTAKRRWEMKREASTLPRPLVSDPERHVPNTDVLRALPEWALHAGHSPVPPPPGTHSPPPDTKRRVYLIHTDRAIVGSTTTPLEYRQAVLSYCHRPESHHELWGVDVVVDHELRLVTIYTSAGRDMQWVFPLHPETQRPMWTQEIHDQIGALSEVLRLGGVDRFEDPRMCRLYTELFRAMRACGALVAISRKTLTSMRVASGPHALPDDPSRVLPHERFDVMLMSPDSVLSTSTLMAQTVGTNKLLRHVTGLKSCTQSTTSPGVAFSTPPGKYTALCPVMPAARTVLGSMLYPSGGGGGGFLRLAITSGDPQSQEDSIPLDESASALGLGAVRTTYSQTVRNFYTTFTQAVGAVNSEHQKRMGQDPRRLVRGESGSVTSPPPPAGDLGAGRDPQHTGIADGGEYLRGGRADPARPGDSRGRPGPGQRPGESNAPCSARYLIPPLAHFGMSPEEAKELGPTHPACERALLNSVLNTQVPGTVVSKGDLLAVLCVHEHGDSTEMMQLARDLDLTPEDHPGALYSTTNQPPLSEKHLADCNAKTMKRVCVRDAVRVMYDTTVDVAARMLQRHLPVPGHARVGGQKTTNELYLMYVEDTLKQINNEIVKCKWEDEKGGAVRDGGGVAAGEEGSPLSAGVDLGRMTREQLEVARESMIALAEKGHELQQQTFVDMATHLDLPSRVYMGLSAGVGGGLCSRLRAVQTADPLPASDQHVVDELVRRHAQERMRRFRHGRFVEIRAEHSGVIKDVVLLPDPTKPLNSGARVLRFDIASLTPLRRGDKGMACGIGDKGTFVLVPPGTLPRPVLGPPLTSVRNVHSFTSRMQTRMLALLIFNSLAVQHPDVRFLTTGTDSTHMPAFLDAHSQEREGDARLGLGRVQLEAIGLHVATHGRSQFDPLSPTLGQARARAAWVLQIWPSDRSEDTNDATAASWSLARPPREPSAESVAPGAPRYPSALRGLQLALGGVWQALVGRRSEVDDLLERSARPQGDRRAMASFVQARGVRPEERARQPSPFTARLARLYEGLMRIAQEINARPPHPRAPSLEQWRKACAGFADLFVEMVTITTNRILAQEHGRGACLAAWLGPERFPRFLRRLKSGVVTDLDALVEDPRARDSPLLHTLAKQRQERHRLEERLVAERLRTNPPPPESSPAHRSHRRRAHEWARERVRAFRAGQAADLAEAVSGLVPPHVSALTQEVLARCGLQQGQRLHTEVSKSFTPAQVDLLANGALEGLRECVMWRYLDGAYYSPSTGTVATALMVAPASAPWVVVAAEMADLMEAVDCMGRQVEPSTGEVLPGGGVVVGDGFFHILDKFAESMATKAAPDSTGSSRRVGHLLVNGSMGAQDTSLLNSYLDGSDSRVVVVHAREGCYQQATHRSGTGEPACPRCDVRMAGMGAGIAQLPAEYRDEARRMLQIAPEADLTPSRPGEFRGIMVSDALGDLKDLMQINGMRWTMKPSDDPSTERPFNAVFQGNPALWDRIVHKNDQ